MDDCDCEKTKSNDNWPDEGDYGDDLLKGESFKIINKIMRDKTFYGFNQNAIFNVKLEQNEIEDMNLEDVNIDYSYLNNDSKNYKILEEDDGEGLLLDETETIPELEKSMTYLGEDYKISTSDQDDDTVILEEYPEEYPEEYEIGLETGSEITDTVMSEVGDSESDKTEESSVSEITSTDTETVMSEVGDSESEITEYEIGLPGEK